MRRRSVLAVTGAVAIATATACGSGGSVPATAASPSPTTVVGSTTPQAAEAADVCATATAESLLDALKASPDFYKRVAHPSALTGIECSAPFVVAGTVGTVQGTGVLFRWDGSRWTVLDIGSAMHCAQYGVTAADGLTGCVV
jgi:hypothetical protein